MPHTPEILRQGAQRLGRAFSLGFIGSTMRTSADGGGVVARLGIAGPDGRVTVALAAGESAPLPGGGTVRLVDIFVSPDGSDTAAAIEVVEGAESAAPANPGEAGA